MFIGEERVPFDTRSIYSQVPIFVGSAEKKWQREPETGIQMRFEEMEHEFSFGTFRPGKQDYLFRSSILSGKCK